MFDIGLWEMTCVGTVAFLVLGPEKCLEYSKKLGQWLATIKHASQQWQNPSESTNEHQNKSK